jgi:stress-induced-phosphoprotein 1
LYQSALTEHRNAETLNKLREAEKLQRQRKEEEYKDPELGQQARDRGNERFKNGSYPDAIKEYEEAIKRNPNDFKAYSNRAACYTKLASWYEAYKDAEKCIEIDPTFPKGYSRKAHVHYFMKEYHKALDTYSAGLEHDPNNEELQQGLRRTREQIARANRGELSEEEDKERHERAMQDPEIQQILNDASMQQVLQDIQSNPQSAQSWLQNAAVAQKLKRLSDAGVVKMQ